MIVTLDHPKLGALEVTGVPIHFHGTPCEVRQPPPLQGQHSEELLRELGYSPHEIAELVAEGVAATPVEIEQARRR
jgi:crotonobetainyl-CoA:carnitine CoA-transferase CaiB-like acyl-CoA transferase